MKSSVEMTGKGLSSHVILKMLARLSPSGLLLVIVGLKCTMLRNLLIG